MARTRVLMTSFRVAMWMTFVAVAGYGQETAIEGKLDQILQQLTQLKEENQKLNQEMQDLRREVRDLRSAKTSEPVPENEQLEVLNQRVEDLDTGKVSAALGDRTHDLLSLRREIRLRGFAFGGYGGRRTTVCGGDLSQYGDRDFVLRLAGHFGRANGRRITHGFLWGNAQLAK